MYTATLISIDCRCRTLSLSLCPLRRRTGGAFFHFANDAARQAFLPWTSPEEEATNSRRGGRQKTKRWRHTRRRKGGIFMSQPQTLVPKFGTWDVDDGVPYTMVFEKARAGKGGKTASFDDPSNSLSAFYTSYFEDMQSNSSSHKDSDDLAFLERRGGQQDMGIQRQDRRGAADDLGMGHMHACLDHDLDMQSHYEQAVFRSMPYQHHSNHKVSEEDSSSWNSTAFDIPTTKWGAPSSSVKLQDHVAQYATYEPPPYMHHHRRTSSKPELPLYTHEKKAPNYSGTISYPSTRSRPRSTRGDTPEKSEVPRFGDWDENDPTSGEGFTTIFNHARAEKKTQASNLQSRASNRTDEDLYKPDSSQKTSKGFWNIICCRYVDSL